MEAGECHCIRRIAVRRQHPQIFPGRTLAGLHVERDWTIRGLRASIPWKAGRWQVSTEGARYPIWSRTRPELFYYSNDERIKVVPYAVVGDEFRAEKPRPFTNERLAALPNTFSIDLHPDGERFAVLLPELSPEAKLNKVVFVLDFFDYLRQIAPVAR